MISWVQRSIKTYTKQIGSEGPSCLQTKIDVGCVDKSTTAETDEDSSERKNVLAFRREIVKWLEGVEREVVMMLSIQGLDALYLEILLVVTGCQWRLEGVFLLGENGPEQLD